jgi:hypothetical protein
LLGQGHGLIEREALRKKSVCGAGRSAGSASGSLSNSSRSGERRADADRPASSPGTLLRGRRRAADVGEQHHRTLLDLGTSPPYAVAPDGGLSQIRRWQRCRR